MDLKCRMCGKLISMNRSETCRECRTIECGTCNKTFTMYTLGQENCNPCRTKMKKKDHRGLDDM